MVSQEKLLRVAAVVLGLVLVGVVGFQLLEPGSTLHVEHVPAEGDVPAGVTPMQYENLSTAGQDAIQAAFESPDDTTTLSAGERPPDFRYGNGRIDHYVVFNGEYYRVTTGDRGLLSFVNGVFAYLLLALGVLAIVLGGLGLARDDTGEN